MAEGSSARTDGTVVAPPAIGATNLITLQGGVSGALVWRAELGGRAVVIKRTDQLEIDTLQRLAGLDEPMISTLIDFGEDDHGPWMVIDFHPGAPAGLTAELPDEVHRCLGRIHAHFAERTFGEDIERIEEPFVIRTMTEFAPHTLLKARSIIGERLDRRARDLLQRLVSDDTFRIAAGRFDQTLLHSDLYGLNVLLPTAGNTLPMIIDWNTARIGPAMFDVAMTADYESSARRAHDQGWQQVRGCPPDRWGGVVSHAWSQTLIHAGFAGVLAIRHSAEEAARMIMVAEKAYARFTALVHDQH